MPGKIDEKKFSLQNMREKIYLGQDLNVHNTNVVRS